MIDVREWRDFRLGDLFKVIPAKGKNSTLLNDGDDMAYIAASKENNGFNRMVSVAGFEDWVSEGNCLQLIHIGDAAAGYCNYIHGSFIGMSGKSSCAYNDNMNEFSGLFIASVIQRVNSGKYSFKESWTGQKVFDTIIKLPVTASGEPDWAYMERYMRQVMEDCERKYRLLVQIVKEKHPVCVRDWKEFRVGELFDKMTTGSLASTKVLPDGDVPVVSSSMNSNGVLIYADVDAPFENQMTVACIGAGAGYVTYHATRFNATVNCGVLFSRFHMTECVGLFLSSILTNRMLPKYDYKHVVTADRLLNEIIKLPVTVSGEPDWAYMEQYMRDVMDRQAYVVQCLKAMQVGAERKVS